MIFFHCSFLLPTEVLTPAHNFSPSVACNSVLIKLPVVTLLTLRLYWQRFTKVNEGQRKSKLIKFWKQWKLKPLIVNWKTPDLWTVEPIFPLFLVLTNYSRQIWAASHNRPCIASNIMSAMVNPFPHGHMRGVGAMMNVSHINIERDILRV